MTRSVLLVIGGVLMVTAISAYVVRSLEVEGSAVVTNARADAVTAMGVFYPNLGQAPSDAFFFLKRRQSAVLLKATSIDVEVHAPDNRRSQRRPRLYFVSASRSPKVVGLEPIAGLSGFKAVRYHGIYPGIDLTVAAETDKLSATFTVAVGADPSLILFTADGLDDALVGIPTAYQVRDGSRMPVSVSFEAGLYGSTRLTLGRYDVDVPVEIDFRVGI